MVVAEQSALLLRVASEEIEVGAAFDGVANLEGNPPPDLTNGAPSHSLRAQPLAELLGAPAVVVVDDADLR